VLAGDEHRVLAVEADAGPGGALAVDVLVLVHEHAVVAPEPPAERVELLAQPGVAVRPRVARQPALGSRRLGPGRVVALGGGDDRARTGEQRLGMARDLRLGHGEAHPCEQPPGPAFQDVALGLGVRLGGRGPDDVDPELRREAVELGGRHVGPTVPPARIAP
jgi:hypothetical protein